MNYLGHYVYNHSVCRLEPRPHFVLGVVLPDLWPRFSRRRRIRWRAVRGAAVSDRRVAQLREGMLNHVAVDQRFHALPSFVRWQRELKQRVMGGQPRSAVVDFLAHVALELMLDHQLACQQPRVAEEIYSRMGSCDLDFVEREVGLLGDVDAQGLAREIQGFITRHYLAQFTQRDTLLRAIDFVLGLTSITDVPSRDTILALLDLSAELVDPDTVWTEMRAAEPAGVLQPDCA